MLAFRVCLLHAALATLLLVLSNAAVAGGFYERNGVALAGYDPVAYFTAGKPVRGSPAHVAEWSGARFHFATRENRDAFAADPMRYAPQYGGFCAYGVAGGYKAAIDPAAFTVVDGRLYLNYNRRIHRLWSADIPGFVSSADRNWPAVSKQTTIVR